MKEAKPKRWKTSSTSVYRLGYHQIWRPTKCWLHPEVRLKELLSEKASELGLVIDKMETMPDHLHLFVKAQLTDAPHFIVSQLKGFTSFRLRNELP